MYIEFQSEREGQKNKINSRSVSSYRRVTSAKVFNPDLCICGQQKQIQNRTHEL